MSAGESIVGKASTNRSFIIIVAVLLLIILVLVGFISYQRGVAAGLQRSILADADRSFVPVQVVRDSPSGSLQQESQLRALQPNGLSDGQLAQNQAPPFQAQGQPPVNSYPPSSSFAIGQGVPQQNQMVAAALPTSTQHVVSPSVKFSQAKRPAYGNFNSLRDAYKRGEISRSTYDTLHSKMKDEEAQRLARLKDQHRRGQISKSEYRARVDAVRNDYH